MDFLKKAMAGKKADPKAPAEEKPKPKRNVLGGSNPQNAEAMKAAGMKKGGKVSGYKKGGRCK